MDSMRKRRQVMDSSNSFTSPNVDQNDKQPEPRSILDPIIVSTIPHYFASWFVCCDFPNEILLAVYFCVILFSSTMSIIWHYSREARDWKYSVDYLLAFAWSVCELYAAFQYGGQSLFLLAVGLNIVNIVTNKMADGMSNYQQAHAFWHLFSCGRAIFLAYMIGKSSELCSLS